MPGKKGAASYILDDEGRRLVEENTRLVPYAIAKRFGISAAQDEDLVSIGNIALCKAAATYNPNGGAKFSTYAYKCIINNIYNYNRHEFERECSRGNREFTVLNSQMPADDGTIEERIDFIQDMRTDTEREAISNIVSDVILPHIPTWRALESSGLTMAAFAKTKNVSKQRIHQRIVGEAESARAALISSGYAEVLA